MIPNNHGVGRMVRTFNEAASVSQTLTKTGALVEEEVAELLEACEKGDRTAIAKEACDVVWTAVDVLVAHGVDFYAAFTEVYRSNLSKLPKCPACIGSGVRRYRQACPHCGGTGKGQPERRPDGKVLKGPGYQPPDPQRLLGRAA